MKKSNLLLTLWLVFLALHTRAQTCNTSGIIIQGVECKLVFANNTVMHPCEAPPEYALLNVGDTIQFSFEPSGCFSFCQQGMDIKITCLSEKEVQAYFAGAMGNASFLFTDLSLGDSLHTWSWTFGDGGTSTEQHATHFYAVPGWYEVCLTVTGTDSQGQLLSDTYCDQIYINDGCVDSSQICLPGSLCCDAPLFEPVCGCNGITYNNACVAAYFGGVLSSSPGACASSTQTLAYFKSIELLPNPANGATSIYTELPQDVEVSIQIISLEGKSVKEAFRLTLPAGAQRTPLDVRTLPSGMYLVYIGTGEVVVSKKLVIKH